MSSITSTPRSPSTDPFITGVSWKTKDSSKGGKTPTSSEEESFLPPSKSGTYPYGSSRVINVNGRFYHMTISQDGVEQELSDDDFNRVKGKVGRVMSRMVQQGHFGSLPLSEATMNLTDRSMTWKGAGSNKLGSFKPEADDLVVQKDFNKLEKLFANELKLYAQKPRLGIDGAIWRLEKGLALLPEDIELYLNALEKRDGNFKGFLLPPDLFKKPSKQEETIEREVKRIIRDNIKNGQIDPKLRIAVIVPIKPSEKGEQIQYISVLIDFKHKICSCYTPNGKTLPPESPFNSLLKKLLSEIPHSHLDVTSASMTINKDNTIHEQKSVDNAVYCLDFITYCLDYEPKTPNKSSKQPVANAIDTYKAELSDQQQKKTMEHYVSKRRTKISALLKASSHPTPAPAPQQQKQPTQGWFERFKGLFANTPAATPPADIDDSSESEGDEEIPSDLWNDIPETNTALIGSKKRNTSASSTTEEE
jgi:hypothetical protein